MTLATPETSSAADSDACRPTRADPISSWRPVSSLARVCRITVKMAISAANNAAHTPYRHAVNPPTESLFSRP